MTDLPDVSPMLDTIFGGSYRAQLRQTLLDRADETDDPAYAQRLREAADGRRPLRSLLSDPSFHAAVKLDEVDSIDVESRSPDLEQRAALMRDLSEYEREHGRPTFPPAAELARHVNDALARAQRTRDVVAADELTGWQGSQQARDAERNGSHRA
jgi:hypothetical protein